MADPFDNDFNPQTFPDLYPENLQDMVNESYTHDKVLPRVAGKDYNETAQDKSEEGTEGYGAEGKDPSDGQIDNN